MAEQALDLIALALTAGDGTPMLSSPRAAALLRLKTVIEGRLSDPNLKPAEAAAAAGISVRYANDLLAEENTSVERVHSAAAPRALPQRARGSAAEHTA